MPQPDAERAALDAQYNLRAAVPEHLTYFARYEGDSATLRARWPGKLDLAYGSTPRQAIDLFLPRDAAAAPILAFIHGGYWQSRDRKDFSFVAGPWLERGVAVALLGYDLAPDGAHGCDRRAGARRPCLALSPRVGRTAATPRGCMSPVIPQAAISRRSL